TAKSCSGLVPPPGPPCSLGVRRSTSTILSSVAPCPSRPPVISAFAVYAMLSGVFNFFSFSSWPRWARPPVFVQVRSGPVLRLPVALTFESVDELVLGHCGAARDVEALGLRVEVTLRRSDVDAACRLPIGVLPTLALGI